MTDKLNEYGWSFQVKAIAAMFQDRSFLQQIVDIILPEYFESDANIWILDVVIEHFYEFKAPPTKDVLKVKLTDLSDDGETLYLSEGNKFGPGKEPIKSFQAAPTNSLLLYV